MSDTDLKPLQTDFDGVRQDKWGDAPVEHYHFEFENGFGVSLLRGILPDERPGNDLARKTMGYENGNWEAMLAQDFGGIMLPIFNSSLYPSADEPIVPNLDNAGINALLTEVASWQPGSAK